MHSRPRSWLAAALSGLLCFCALTLSTSAQQIPYSGTMTAPGFSQAIPLQGGSSCSIVLSGTATGFVVVPQVASDSPNNSLAATYGAASGIGNGSITALGTYTGNAAASGLYWFRFQLSQLSTGTLNYTETCSNANVSAALFNPCLNNIPNTLPISFNTASIAQIINPVPSSSIYVCEIDLMAAGATNVTMEYGGNTACAQGTTLLSGAYPFTTSSPSLVQGNGGGIVAQTAPSTGFCLANSAAIQVSGKVNYVESAGGAAPAPTTSPFVALSVWPSMVWDNAASATQLNYGGWNATPAQMQFFTRFGEESLSARKAETDCPVGSTCAPVVYSDINKVYTVDYYYASLNTAIEEGGWLHAYNATIPLQTSNRQGSTSVYYVGGSGNASAISSWVNSNQLNVGQNNLIFFSDDTVADCLGRFGGTYAPYEYGGAAIPNATCTTDNVNGYLAWMTGLRLPSGITPSVMVDNYDSPTGTGGDAINTQIFTASGSNVPYAMSENVIVSDNYGSVVYNAIVPQSIPSVINTLSVLEATRPEPTYVQWASFTTTQAPNTVGSNNACTTLSVNVVGACGQEELRRVAMAALWLGGDPQHEVNFSNFNGSSGASLYVYPEQELVTGTPVQALPVYNTRGTNGSGCATTSTFDSGYATHGGAAALVVACGAGGNTVTPTTYAMGVFRREFTNCSYFGVNIGNCAVVLNATNAAVTVQSAWLTNTYGHMMTQGTGTTNGADVLTACPSPTTTACPTTAVNYQGAAFTAGTTTVPADDAVFLFQ